MWIEGGGAVKEERWEEEESAAPWGGVEFDVAICAV